MAHISLFARAAASAALMFAMLPAAQAETISYQDMCIKAADMPAEYGGESDLKGNAKLPAYCKCFSDAFGARAKKAFAYMQANPGKAPPESRQEVAAGDLAMRNSCRKQFGLPAAIDPDKANPPASSKGK